MPQNGQKPEKRNQKPTLLNEMSRKTKTDSCECKVFAWRDRGAAAEDCYTDYNAFPLMHVGVIREGHLKMVTRSSLHKQCERGE